MPKNKIFICIPTYNEADNIVTLLQKIEKVTKEIKKFNIEVIVIDDNSPDGTAQKVEQFKSSLAVHIINNKSKSGLGAAYIKAFKYALKEGAYAICQMDADHSHNPLHLIEIAKHIEDHDFIIGSRYIKDGKILNWNLLRRGISRYGNLYSQIILGIGINDLTGGYNCWRDYVLKKVDLDGIQANGFFFQIELKFKALKDGFRTKEVPIIFKDRELGQSKFGANIFKEALIKPWSLKFKK